MSFNATVTPGWTFATGDTVTATTLNAAATPNVTIPDNMTYAGSAGTVSAPGFAINGDPDTGIGQLGGANTLSFIVGGVEVARPTGQGIMFASGSASLPSIYFSGDPNTGRYWVSADTMAESCGGNKVATWSASGLDAVGLSVGGLAVRTAGLSTATVSFATDFIGSSTSWGTATTTVATGAVSQIATGSGSGDPNGRGLIGQTVSAVSDRAVVSTPLTTTVGAVTRLRLEINGILSTPGERYYIIAGAFAVDTVTTAAGSGAFFQYIDSASAQWQTVTYNGSTRETQTTAITVAIGVFYTLEVRHTAASTFEFYINGALVTTHTSVSFGGGIGDFALSGAAIEKTVGSTGRGIITDSLEVQASLART